MRIIEACGSEIRTVSVSPDGRFLAASTDIAFLLFHWGTGELVMQTTCTRPCEQVVFYPQKDWLARSIYGHALHIDSLDPLSASTPLDLAGKFAGGVAISPDGRVLIATHIGERSQIQLARWSLPTFQPLTGFNYWSPFRRLAFSPNGQFIAGIWSNVRSGWPSEFEIRYAVSGGLDYRYRLPDDVVPEATGFVSFTRDSALCAFGWENEFHVVDISTGTNRYLCRVEASFRDAAFTGSGQRFATVSGSGRMKLWDPKTWEMMREYDWGCGVLTCLAFTADGSAGVCGTADGKLVQFDVDE